MARVQYNSRSHDTRTIITNFFSSILYTIRANFMDRTMEIDYITRELFYGIVCFVQVFLPPLVINLHNSMNKQRVPIE
jgi:hypothetical protein